MTGRVLPTRWTRIRHFPPSIHFLCSLRLEHSPIGKRCTPEIRPAEQSATTHPPNSFSVPFDSILQSASQANSAFCSPSLPYKNSEVQLCCQTRPPRFRFPFHVKHRLNAKVLPLFDIRCAHQLPIRRIFSPLGSLRNCCASFAASFEIFLEKR